MRVQEYDLLPDALCESKAASSQSTSYLLPLIIPAKFTFLHPITVAFTMVLRETNLSSVFFLESLCHDPAKIKILFLCGKKPLSCQRSGQCPLS